VRRRYGIGFGPRAALGDAVLGMRSELARGIQSLAEQAIIDRADEALREIGELKTALSNHSPIQGSGAPLVAPDGPWSKLRDLLRSNLAISQGQLNDPDGSLAGLETTATHITELEALLQAWSESPVDPQWFGGEIDLLVELAGLSDEALASAQHTRALAQIIEEGIATPILQEAVYRNPSRELFESLRSHAQELALAWQAHLDQRAPFADLTELDLEAWHRPTDGKLEAIKSRNQTALAEPDWLSNWLDYVRVRYRTASIEFNPLAKAVERGALAADSIDAGYKLAVHDLLARQILKEMPRLAQFSGNTQQALQSQFRQYDEKLKRLQRERIAWKIAQNEVPVGQLGAKVSSYTDLALLRHECAKRQRHIPLRQLVLRAGNALAALKPCFMMGPMSVAQYLALGELNFDLVVISRTYKATSGR
jgi:hypothetical protein